ncbi:MAG: glycosyltransferase [Planctomycetota bacterium]|nr:glycosyltransferase [Planctomycetota bacterium]
MSRAEIKREPKSVFVTVGTQCPFPRLVQAIDEWAGLNPHVKIFAQTAEHDAHYANIDAAAFMQPEQYMQAFADSDIIVAHAGIGTILNALESEKPIVILPRKAKLGEHRNEHQHATASRFRTFPGVTVIDAENELGDAMLRSLCNASPAAVRMATPTQLIERIQHEINVLGKERPKMLAVASGGGHWVQLCRLLQDLDQRRFEVVCATTRLGDDALSITSNIIRIQDGNAKDKFSLLRSGFDVLRTVLIQRPDILLTTGAAPGYFAVIASRIIGAKTIWLDSIANANQLSLCGQKVGRFANTWLTQWPLLATAGGPEYAGSLIPSLTESEAKDMENSSSRSIAAWKG